MPILLKLKILYTQEPALFTHFGAVGAIASAGVALAGVSLGVPSVADFRLPEISRNGHFGISDDLQSPAVKAAAGSPVRFVEIFSGELAHLAK